MMVGAHVLLCAAICDRVDHHQGKHTLPGLLMTGRFLQATRALQRNGTNTSFVVIDWVDCLLLHPAHVTVWTPGSDFNASAHASWAV